MTMAWRTSGKAGGTGLSGWRTRTEAAHVLRPDLGGVLAHIVRALGRLELGLSAPAVAGHVLASGSHVVGKVAATHRVCDSRRFPDGIGSLDEARPGAQQPRDPK